MKYIFIIVFLVHSSYGQIRHLSCNGTQLNIILPKKGGYVHDYHYAEGYFYTVTYQDSSSLIFHCGLSVIKPFIEEKYYIITDSTFNRFYRERSGYNITNHLFWKERFYFKNKFTILYLNVRKNDIPTFDKSLTYIY